MISAKMTITDNNNCFYSNGSFQFDKEIFNCRLWVAQITGSDPNYIFERSFMPKQLITNSYVFNAPSDGVYHIKADIGDEVIDNFVKVSEGEPSIIGFTDAKNLACELEFEKQAEFVRKINQICRNA